jgi:hypothetical protein
VSSGVGPEVGSAPPFAKELISSILGKPTKKALSARSAGAHDTGDDFDLFTLVFPRILLAYIGLQLHRRLADAFVQFIELLSGLLEFWTFAFLDSWQIRFPSA